MILMVRHLLHYGDISIRLGITCTLHETVAKDTSHVPSISLLVNDSCRRHVHDAGTWIEEELVKHWLPNLRLDQPGIELGPDVV